MYKKLLTGLLIFLSSLFLFSNNVSALDSFDYTNRYHDINLSNVEIRNQLQRASDYYSSNNINYSISFNFQSPNYVSFLNSISFYKCDTDTITAYNDYSDSRSFILKSSNTSNNCSYTRLYCSSSTGCSLSDITSKVNDIINNNVSYSNAGNFFNWTYFDSTTGEIISTDYISPIIYDTNINYAYSSIPFKNYSHVLDDTDYTLSSLPTVKSYYDNIPEPYEPILVTSSEINTKTGKNVSQSAIDECYSNNRPYMVVYSEGTTSYIGNYAILCSDSPIAYIKQDNTWGQGYHFTFYDSTTDQFSVTNGSVSKAMYKNGITECTDYSNTCGQWGRKNYFTFYYSNFDIVYFPEGSEASLRGQTKYACNSESCLSISSNDYINPTPEPEPEPVITYDHTLAIMPYYYNYAYIKFKGIGNLEAYLGIVESSMVGFGTSYKSYFYDIYKNGVKERTMVINHNNNDISISYLFENSLPTDTYIIVFPFTNMKGSDYSNPLLETDTLDIKFTIPGVIEYGTDQNVYMVSTDSSGNISITEDGSINRSEITDLLDPPETKPEEIISNPSSTNTLTNDSLNEFSWPYSLFSRDGSNISDIKLSASYSNTSSLNINDFDNRLIINYGSEIYKINLNNCMLQNQCNLTSYEKTLIKKILFNREVELTDEYLSFSTKPLINITTSNTAQLNVGLSLEFSSSVELTISSFLLAINDISNSNYNVYFKLYDNSGNVHTLYKTALNSANHLGVNQFQLDNRTADIYKVELMFVYNQNSSNFSSLDTYHLDFSEFNIFANTDLVHIYTDNTNITYQTCAWNNFFCHIQNGFTWLVYEAPILKDFWNLLLRITNIFNMIWTFLTYIFMPLDIIPPILGVDISDLALSICALYLIVKLWIGGKS